MQLDRLWQRLALAMLLLMPAYSGCERATEDTQPIMVPPVVSFATATKREVRPTDTFHGRVEAVNKVELRARVEGFVEDRLFDDGAEVETGDLLIRLEKARHETQIAQVKGELTAAQGELDLARLEVERLTKLVERDVAAQARLDGVNAQYTRALGEIKRLEASLARSELDLSYTEIRAPVSGRISRFAFSVGDFVTSSSGPLAVIVSQDPMHVTFPVSARRLLEIRRAAEAAGRDPRDVTVRVRLPDGSLHEETGLIDFADVRVDSTTDSVTARATVPNPAKDRLHRVLMHNQLVDVIVEQPAELTLVVPQAAILRDQAGPYVLVVTEDDRVEQRRIATGAAAGSEISVTEGLEQGERVIVAGLQKVQPGQQVTPRSRVEP